MRSECTRIVECHFENVDFTGAIFGDALTENCVFKNVVFNNANMQGYRDFGNQYETCFFVRTDFAGAGIGYRGSHYDRCLFDNSKFRRTRFIRAEFDNCQFHDCKLKSVEFNASSFEFCEFKGKLHGVSFCNGYFFGEQDNMDFGIPRQNRMLHVSFAEAELKMMDFRGACDLSTVIMPESGEYRRYDHFVKRLIELRNRLGEFSKEDADEIENLFIEIYMLTAVDLNQDTFILNCEDIYKDFGKEAGQRMIQIMDGAGE